MATPTKDNVPQTVKDVANAVASQAFGFGGVQQPVSGNLPFKTPPKDTSPVTYTADQIIQEILSNKGVDPTTVGTVTPKSISPITPNSPTSGGMDFSTSNYGADFTGGGLTYEIDPKTKQHYIAQTDAYGIKHQVAIVGDPKNPNAYVVQDFATATRNIVQQYNYKGGIAGLKQAMWSQGQLKGAAGKASIAAGDKIDETFLRTLYKYVGEMTFTNFYASATQNFQSFDKVLAGAKGYAGTRISNRITYSNKDEAIADLSSFVNEYLGRGATPKEVSDYIDTLTKLEAASPTKAKVTTDALGMETNRVETAGGVSQDQKTALKVAIISQALKAKGIDPAAISKTGGKIAIGMDQLKANAAAYGVRYDDKMALDGMLTAIQPGGSVDKIKEIQKQTAKGLYKNLASAIDAGTSIKDIADQYNYYNNKILEKVTPTDVFDPDIQAALHNDGKSGIMNLNDYMIRLKSKPEWAMTQNARESAADYANTILKQFGLMG